MFIELGCKMYFLLWTVAEIKLEKSSISRNIPFSMIFFSLKSHFFIHSTPPDLMLALPDGQQVKFKFQISKNELLFSRSMSHIIFENDLY